MLKKTLQNYRQGAAGAVMDEYERAAFELKIVAQNVGANFYLHIADAETENEDCRSVQTIISHVVNSGYAYANYIRERISMPVVPFERRPVVYEKIAGEIDKMFAYTIEIFDGRWQTAEDEIFDTVIKTRWGLTYNIDQLLEHAIVHILRHRRQIEKFTLKFESDRKTSRNDK